MRRPSIVVSMLVLCACGGEPAVIQPGGGVHGVSSGSTTVVVIDGEGAPIGGVEVRGGLPPEERSLGRTDARGELRPSGRFDAFTAVHDGVAVSVIGADASTVTLSFPRPVRPSVEVRVAVDFAALALEGADDVIAVGGFTRDPRLDAVENSVMQPPDAVLECLRSAGERCELRFRVRQGVLQVFTAFARVDRRGTPALEDDRLTAAGLAIGDTIDTAALVDPRVAVSLLPATELTRISVAVGEPPADLRSVVGVPGARSNASGVLVWPIASVDALIPRRLSDADVVHWAIGEASTQGRFSRVVDRASSLFADGETVLLERWIAPPTFATQGWSVRLEGEGLREIELRDAAGAVRWRAHVIAGLSVFTPPIERLDDPTVRGTLTRHAEPADDLSFDAVEARHSQRAWVECTGACL